MDKRTHAYIYQMSWFERPRHRRPHTIQYFADPQYTLWGFDDPLCRISYIKVPIDSDYFSQAIHNSEKAKENAEDLEYKFVVLEYEYRKLEEENEKLKQDIERLA